MSNYGTFGENNPVWKAVCRFTDMLIAGLLFIVTSLPVITIGASACGLYYAAMDSMRKEDGYIFKRFFTGFGKNFKKATIIWLIMLVTGFVFGVDVYFWMSRRDDTLCLVMFIFSLILVAIWLLILTFVFPLQTRFENTIGKTMQNAFLLALTHLPMSVSVVIVLGALVYLGYNSLIFLALALLFGAGPIGFLLVYSYEKIFKKLGYIAEDDGKITEDDYDFDVEVDFDEVRRQQKEDEDAKRSSREADAGADTEAAEENDSEKEEE